ncbi:MAG: metallopeptidase family protein [Patescibacteria group bacterium]
MTLDAFEQLVKEEVLRLPRRFRRRIKNCAFFVAPEPTPEQLRSARVRRGSTLLALYEGVPQLRRTITTSAVLPDRITIFKCPLEALAGDPPDIHLLRKAVYDTIWHEVAHHFGFEEYEVRSLEQKRWQRTR